MKKLGNMILAMLIALAMGLASCSVDSGSGSSGGVAGDSVVLVNELSEINVGDEIEITVKVNGAEISLDDSILTVSGKNIAIDGKKIRATVEGEGKLIVVYNGKEYTFTFSIKPAVDNKVLKSIVASAKTLVVNVEGSVNLPTTATATFENNGTETVNLDSSYVVTSGSEYISVSGTKVTGVAEGSANVKVSYTYNNVTKYDTVSVTVNPKPQPDVVLSSISVSPKSVEVVAGKSAELPAVVTAVYSDGTEASVTPQSYTSSDTSTAIVNGFTVKGVHQGGTTLTVSYTEGDVTKTATISVTVKAAVIEYLVCNDVTVNAESEITLPSGVKAVYSDGSEKTVTVASYTVTEGASYCELLGKTLRGKSEGTAKIKVTAEGKTCVITVTVNPKPVAKLVSISYNGSISVADGKTVALPSTVVAKYDDDTTKDVTPSYSSTSANVEVVDGTVKGKVEGSAVVTASYTEGGVTKTCEINVTVTAAVVESVAFVNNSPVTVEVDSEADLPSTIKATYSNGNVSDVTPVYASRDESIAKIVKTTKVKGVKEGSVTVTASYAGKTAAGAIPVTVTAKPGNGSGSFIINFGAPIVKPELTITNTNNVVTLTCSTNVTSADVTLSSGSHSEKVTTFTNKVATVDISAWGLEDKVTISASGTINTYAVNASCAYIKPDGSDDEEDPLKGKVVVFVKPTQAESGYSNIYLWTSKNSTKLLGAWPGAALSGHEATSAYMNDPTGWYMFDVTEKYANCGENILMILNGSGQTGNKDSEIAGTFWYDGSFHDADPTTPAEPVAPTAEISPASGKEIGLTSAITVNVSFGNDTASVKKAVINGVEKTLSEGSNSYAVKEFATKAGQTITVAVTVKNSKGTATASATYTTADLKEDPFTWDNALMYFVIQDRFYDGDSSNNNSYGRMSTDELGKTIGTFHGGDIKGLTQKLDYVESLGVNSIWITAAYEQQHGWCGGGDDGDFAHYAYHGYYPLDYTMIDKNMGTVEEFRTFVTECHKRGIRVVMDVVMNHTGYLTLQDCQDYNLDIFTGSYNGGKSTDMGFKIGADGANYHAHHSKIDYTAHNDGWAKWWGSSWVRAGVPGYTTGGGDDLTMNLNNLPDVRTDNKTAQAPAPILKTKWSKETSGYDNWIIPAAKSLRTGSGSNTPVEWIEKWLAAWVEEFGIDGFRCDTAKHIERDHWKNLDNLCEQALTKWRNSDRADEYAKNWDEDFFMTGESFGWTGDTSWMNYGFNSMIDFSVAKTGGMKTYTPNLPEWGRRIGSKGLLYISSHDTGLGRASDQVSLGTDFVLMPGEVQIYYGDETSRSFGDTGSDPNQGTRSDFNWSAATGACAKHWGKVGTFRKFNPAVGAGTGSAYKRSYSGSAGENKVAIGVSGSTVDVDGLFANGTTVYNWYDGTSAVVSGGKVTFQGGSKTTPILVSDKNPADYGVN